MYRIKDIQDALEHVVGWEQAFNPIEHIDDRLTESESGLYFQGAHPLVTLDNVRAVMPEDFIFSYKSWNMTVQYKAGDIVRYDNRTWIAKQDNVNEKPSISDFNGDFNDDFGNEYWSLYSFMSDYLRRITRNSIAQVVQTFVQMKSLTRETHTLLERRTFFDGAGRLRATIDNRGKICGYEIVPVRAMGITTKIERIGLQMTGGTGKVRLYLFHSSQYAPLRTIDVEFTNTNGGYQWFDMKDLYLPYISDGNDAGGAWYLCYNQNELPRGMEAVNISKDWSREPCGTCNMGNVQLWRELTQYMQISPFIYTAPADFTSQPELWDIAGMIYTNTVNYGINVEVTVGCDLTDFIISQRDIFKTVIQRQVAATILRTMAMNPDVRVNRNQSNVSRVEVLYELDGNNEGTRPGALGYELRKAYEALRLDTEGIDRLCLTCNNHGVRYTST